jgi:hypothetical protein
MADKDTCPVCDLHSSTLHREGFCPRCWHPEVEHLRSWGFQIRNAILARNTGDLSDTECFMRLVSLANDMPTVTRLDSMPDTTPVIERRDAYGDLIAEVERLRSMLWGVADALEDKGAKEYAQALRRRVAGEITAPASAAKRAPDG